MLSLYGTVLDAYAALAGKKPGNASYNEHKAYIDSNGAAAYVAALNNLFANVSNASMGQSLLQNLGLTSVFTQAQAEAYLASSANRVQAVLDLSQNLKNYSGTDAAILAAKTAYVATIDASYAYASVPTNTVDASVVGADPVQPGNDFKLTTGASDNLTGTTGNDTFSGLISATSSKTTYNATDFVTDASTTDNDTLTLTVNNDFAAAATGTVRNVENIVINVDASTTGTTIGSNSTANEMTVTATNWSGVKSYTVDVVKEISGVNDILLDDAEDGSTVNLGAAFKNGEVTVETAGDDVTIKAAATGSSATPVVITLTAGTAPGDVAVEGAGDLSVQATTATGIVSATAQKGLTVNAAAALVIMGEAKAGDMTITNGDAAVIIDAKATGDISITDTGAGSVKAHAGGTVTMITSTNTNATSVDLTATGTSTIVGGSVTAATLQGNGAAATFGAVASPLADVEIKGDQDVTLNVYANIIDGGTDIINIADNSTAGTFTLQIGGTAGNVDVRGDLIDRLELDIDNVNKTLSVRSGQAVVVTADQATGGTIAVGNAASAATNSVTIVLDDEVRDANAVDIDTRSITQAKTVVIDGSVDSTASGAAVTHVIDALTASGANSNLTFKMGANNLSLDGTTTAGTGTITITGSGTVTDNATSKLTASVIDASSATGSITFDTLLIDAATVKTGSGNDTLVLTTASTGGTFETGAGDDALTLDNSSLANQNVVINMGEGADTLTLDASTELITGTSGSISLAGVETIAFNSGSGQKIQGSLLSGQGYAIKSSSAGSTASIAVVAGSKDSVIDLSALSLSSAVASAMTGTTLVIDASANSVNPIAITGANGAANKITGSSLATDVLTGGDRADTFVIAADADLFDANGLMLDTIAGGGQQASSKDTLLVGTNGATFTIAGTDAWTKLSGVESITTGSNTSAISITLDVTAEASGLTTVDLSGDTSSTASNVINAAEFTSTGATLTGSAGIDTITGGAGGDTITGGAAADVLAGGDGDDIFVYAATGDLFNGSQAITDTSLDGGNGTADTILVGVTTAGNTTSFAIADNDAWTGITGVEKIASVANEAATTIDLDGTAYAAGIRTVDLSATKKATGNVIDVSEYTGLNKANLTLIGSSTGVTTITGGAGNDTITGGSAADVIDGGAGGDTVNFVSGLGDKFVISAANLTAEWTSGTASTTVATVGMDIISGLGAGDDFAFSAYTTAATTTAADNVMDSDALTKGSDLSVTVAENSVQIVRGDYLSNIFTESATGADVLVAFDADKANSSIDAEAFIILGVGANTFTVDAGTGGVISIS